MGPSQLVNPLYRIEEKGGGSMVLTDANLKKIYGGSYKGLIEFENPNRRLKGEIRLPPPIKPKPEIM